MIETFFGDYNEAHLLWLGTWGTPVLVALALGILLVLVLSYLDLRPMRPRWRAHTLLGLRLFVLAIGLTILLEPALELRDVERDRNHVAVLVDGSRSMDVSVPDGSATRRERASDLVDQLVGLWGTQSDDHVFDYFVYGGGEEPAQRTSAASILEGELPADPDSTRTREALESIVDRVGGPADLAGVVLVSDGTDDGALGGRNQDVGAALDADTTDFLQNLGAPVHAFAVTPSKGLEDVAIERVLHDEFAFLRNRVGFDVVLRGIGIDGVGVQVQLLENGESIRSQQVAFEGDDERKTITFELVPEELGKAVYSVVVSPIEGEVLEENNRYHFVMKVIRDKIRVLQVCGRPSWDERFMRRLLKENPNVDLISFFILRTTSNVQLAAQDELSLIPFPKDELFDQELPSFDLVIFQNFNFGPYVLRRYLDRVAEFVAGGGGFLMVGGDLSFSNGGYFGTPVGDLLPVQIYPQNAGSDALIHVERFAPEISDVGERHPIMRLSFDPTENARLWDELPSLEGTNVVAGLREGATALAHHPQLKDGSGEPMPVIAVDEVGEGRTMAFTTDSSWLWSFESGGAGGTSRQFTNFWNNAIRWLIQDPELKLIKVDASTPQVAPGDGFGARIEVLAPDYSPAPAAAGSYRVVRRPLDEPWRDDTIDIVVEGEFETDERGLFELQIPGGVEGVYTVEAEVERDDNRLADDDLVLVVLDSPEMRDVMPRNDLLRQVSRVSGGRFVQLPTPVEALDELPFNEPRVTRINQRKLVALWDSWMVFGLLALVLAAEWLLRRRWGRI